MVYSFELLRRKFCRIEICSCQPRLRPVSLLKRTLYSPRAEPLSVGAPLPTKQSGQTQFTCFTVLLGSWLMISPKLALFAVAVPFEMVKFHPVV